MYLILNQTNRVVDITDHAQYVKRQYNGYVVGCEPDDADAIYSANTDRFYPLEQIGYNSDSHTLVEVEAVPDDVVAGYYFYGAGEFYSSEDDQKRLEQAKVAADAPIVASIAFVALAETGQLDDVTATEHMSLFEAWAHPINYTVGQIRQHDGKLYRCVKAHTSQADWTPPVAASLWALTGDPTVEYPDWAQPIGAHDAYAKGDKSAHNGKRWTSDIDGNVWEPGVYGWTEDKEVDNGQGN